MGSGLLERRQATARGWDGDGAAEGVVDQSMERWWRWGAWVPIALLVAVTVLLWAINPQGQYYPPKVVLVVNLATRAAAWLLVAYVMGRSVLVSGAPGPLFFGLGMTFWGAGGVLTALWSVRDLNVAVTISTMTLWLAGLSHLLGAAVSIRFTVRLKARRAWLWGAHVVGLALVAAIVITAWMGQMPVFVIPGVGWQQVLFVLLT
jgi:hypothetical protein